MRSLSTLKFAQTLRDKAKLNPEQAENISEAFAAANSEVMVTKTYLDMWLEEFQLVVGGMIVGIGGVLVAITFLGH